MKKVIISEKFLLELNISDKNKSKYVNNGTYQYAFQSSDAEKIVKFGRNNVEDEIDIVDKKKIVSRFVKRPYNDSEIYEFEEMKKYPKYFPIIYKITKGFIVLEKLDAEQAKKDFRDIEDVIYRKYPEINFTSLLIEFKEASSVNKMMQYFIEVHQYLEKQLPKLNLISPYYKFIALVKNIEHLKLFEIDIGSGNFGYDKKGNLKMLDI